MSVINHECIIATTWSSEVIDKVSGWISTLPEDQQKLFTIIPSIHNGLQTIILGPDGSNKGWGKAMEGEILRNHFIDKLKEFDYDDGSNPFYYVEVGYGEFGQKVLRGNCVNRYDKLEYFDEERNES